MKKKLSLDDLKVQSFVTALTEVEAQQVMGGASYCTEVCTQMPDTAPCGTNTVHSFCCDPTMDTDASCGCSGYTTICYSCYSDLCYTVTTDMCPDTSASCCPPSTPTAICPDTSAYCGC